MSPPTAISNWTDTQIIANVPTTATTGPVKVIAGGVASNTSVGFTVGAVAVNSVSPASGSPGTPVQISGSGFGASQGTSTVKFSGQLATVTGWSDTAINANVSMSASTGPVVVTVAGIASNSYGELCSHSTCYYCNFAGERTGFHPSPNFGSWIWRQPRAPAP